MEVKVIFNILWSLPMSSFGNFHDLSMHSFNGKCLITVIQLLLLKGKSFHYLDCQSAVADLKTFSYHLSSFQHSLFKQYNENHIN